MPDPIWTQAGLHDDTNIPKVNIGHMGGGGGWGGGGFRFHQKLIQIKKKEKQDLEWLLSAGVVVNGRVSENSKHVVFTKVLSCQPRVTVRS